MNVRELEEELELIKDKDLDVRVSSPYDGKEIIWLAKVEECFGEVRLIGEELNFIGEC